MVDASPVSDVAESAAAAPATSPAEFSDGVSGCSSPGPGLGVVPLGEEVAREPARESVAEDAEGDVEEEEGTRA